MRSIFKWVVPGIVGVMLVAVLALAHRGRETERRGINPPGTPSGYPFSRGIAVGNTVYVAGHIGSGKNGKIVEGGIGPETKQALENIKEVVTEAGFSMSDIVSVNVYLTDINDIGEMSKAYTPYFADPKPVRATVQVAGLVGTARVEISAIAQKAR